MFFLLFAAIAFGFLLIFLIGLTAPKNTAIAAPATPDDSPLAGLDAEQLGKVVSVVLDRMGIELDRASGGRGELEIFAVNPTPITGGRILIHCVPAPVETGGRIQGLRIQQFIRAVRSARVSKGLFFTTGEITPDARLEADGEQVELFDGRQLAELVDRYASDLGSDAPPDA